MRSLIAATISIVATTTTAFAQESTAPDWANKNGGVGVGGNTTLGGSNGVNIRTYVGPQIGLGLTFGFSTVSVDNNGAESSNTRFDLAPTFIYSIARSNKAVFSLYGGLDLVHLRSSQTLPPPSPSVDASATDLLVTLGIQGEYFPTEFLSLFVAGGLVIDPQQDEEIDGSSVVMGDGIAIELASQLQGSAGFTVWFK